MQNINLDMVVNQDKSALVLAIMQHSLQEQERNVAQGGSCWGCNANAALIFLAQYALSEFVLSDRFDMSTDVERVYQYMNTDLCLFTIKTESPGLSGLSVRRCMAQRARETAAPVVEAVRGSALEDTVMYRRLKSAVDHLSLMAS